MRAEVILTERLRLRGFMKSDARFAIGIWNDPEMGEYLPDEAMDEIDPEYLAEIEALGEDEECCYMIAELAETGERVGTCSYIPEDGGKAYDIAYCVHRDYQRRGYATEMARGMVEFARGRGAERVTVRVNRENLASNRVMEKLGFVVVGEKKYVKRGTEREFVDYLYELKF